MQGTAPKTILENKGYSYVDSGRKRRYAKDLKRRRGGTPQVISFLFTTVEQRATAQGGGSRGGDLSLRGDSATAELMNLPPPARERVNIDPDCLGNWIW